MKDDFFATVKLIKLNLRQHRVFLFLWILFPALVVLATVVTTTIMFPTQQSLLDFSSTLNDPIVVGMHGRVLDFSVAGYTVWRTKVLCSLLTGIFSFITVTRFTRQLEEAGRRDLVSAGAVGKYAPLAAALITAIGINMVMALLMIFAMMLGSLGFVGSLAHAVGIALCGIFFCAAAAVFAQIFSRSRSVTNASVALLAILMAIHYGWNIKGQLGGAMYLSPLEWSYLIRPFAGERFIVLLPAVLIIALLILFSFKLSASRDVGAGFIPERTGRSTARPGFKSSLALAWRTQKGLLFPWLGFFTLIGFALGSVSPIMADITFTNPGFAEFVESLGGPNRAFMALMIYVLGIIISIYPILVIQGLRSEESALRTEVMLALPVSRLRLAVSHLLMAFAGAAAILTAMGFAIGAGGVLSTGNPEQFSWLFNSAVLKIPAAWVMAGIAALMFGLVPRAMAGISYALFGVFLLLEFFWEQQAVSDVVYKLSPFAHTYPANKITVLTITGLTLVSAALAALGLLAFRRRDITSN